MPRNSFLRAGRLASHPGFRLDTGSLHCPVCPERFGTTTAYDRHYLGHDPAETDAIQHLSWQTYQREAPRRGWKTANELGAAS